MKVWSRLFNFQIWKFWGIHLKFQQRPLCSFRLKKVKPGSACCFASQLVLFSSPMENYDLERYSDTTTLMTNNLNDQPNQTEVLSHKLLVCPGFLWES